MRNNRFVIILFFLILLTGCGLAENAVNSIVETINEDKGISLQQEESGKFDTDSSEEGNQPNAVGTTLNQDNQIVPSEETSQWNGFWQIENEYMYGNLAIYNETAEGFYFDIFVSSGHLGELQNVYAAIDGNVAKSTKDEYGCEITLTKNDGAITTEESPDCLAWHGAGINFEHTFIFTDALIQFAINEEFLDIVKQGYLVKGTYPIGTKLKKIIDETGAYSDAVNLQGAEFHFFGNQIAYATDTFVEDDEADVIAIRVYRFGQNFTPEELISYFGEPLYQGEHAAEGFGFVMGFSIGNDLELGFQYGMNSDRLESVDLIYKP
ncbi:hypothetical protein [Sporosarcina sp. Marseille-Q4943]|uniref:hypothetical protein n=1 Tax=Sporosarcina sp. Marseille-Q4943 TaxID=2942204 RepID=UPI00208DC377|nr:hypothetical protein [Sporosarcina sp. Marseille-Q4943]